MCFGDPAELLEDRATNEVKIGIAANVETVLSLGNPFESLFDDGGSLYAMLGVLAAAPVAATARLLAYVDGRAEQDGWDIQLRFQALKQREEQLA